MSGVFSLLRPPGARPEAEFLRRCVQCGQCAAACPFNAIAFVGAGNPLAAGTPVVDWERAPCRLCMRCGPACPTGALLPVAKEDAGMGLAVIDKDNCFTYEGSVLCKTCHESCPLKARAITLKDGVYPVITEDCVGCGVCAKVCPRACVDVKPKRELSLWWAIRRLFYRRQG